jgi:pimeloyl-ACP methyl ester carboxylesterase
MDKQPRPATSDRSALKLFDVSSQSLLKRLAARYSVKHRDTSLPDTARIVAPDGVELSYLDWRGHGEPILFLHGGALTAHSWDLVCLGLRDQWRCLALDMRGHGDSGWADEYRIETGIDDISALVATNTVERLHLVGNSLGGVVAAHYAAAHPSRVASLTLVDVGPSVNFDATQTIRDFIDHVDGASDFDSAVEAGMNMSPRIDREALEYRLLHSMRQKEDRRLYWKQDRRRMHDYGYFLGKVEEIARVAPQIAAPVLVMRGARSRVFSDEAARECAELFANGHWLQIADSGHNIQEANPAGLVTALNAFLPKL